jgi:hypothetical protein
MHEKFHNAYFLVSWGQIWWNIDLIFLSIMEGHRKKNGRVYLHHPCDVIVLRINHMLPT